MDALAALDPQVAVKLEQPPRQSTSMQRHALSYHRAPTTKPTPAGREIAQRGRQHDVRRAGRQLPANLPAAILLKDAALNVWVQAGLDVQVLPVKAGVDGQAASHVM